LGAEFVQQISLRLRRRLLSVSETWFLETTHQTALSLSSIKIGFARCAYSAARADATHYPRSLSGFELRSRATGIRMLKSDQWSPLRVPMGISGQFA
jgi:hypothetical protein